MHGALLVHVHAAGHEQFHLQATHKIQSDSKLSIHGENGLFYKTCSVWASWTSAQENDRYSLFRHRGFNTLLKMQLIPEYKQYYLVQDKQQSLPYTYETKVIEHPAMSQRHKWSMSTTTNLTSLTTKSPADFYYVSLSCHFSNFGYETRGKTRACCQTIPLTRAINRIIVSRTLACKV